MEKIKYGLDILSFGGAIGTVMGIVPPIAAVLSVIWLSMQIYDWIRDKVDGKKTRRD